MSKFFNVNIYGLIYAKMMALGIQNIIFTKILQKLGQKQKKTTLNISQVA